MNEKAQFDRFIEQQMSLSKFNFPKPHSDGNRQRKAKLSPNSLIRRRTTRKSIIERLGGKCVKCGITDLRVLDIDHVSGNGKKMREKNEASLDFIRRDIERAHSNRYQILCANCHRIKTWKQRNLGNPNES